MRWALAGMGPCQRTPGNVSRAASQIPEAIAGSHRPGARPGGSVWAAVRRPGAQPSGHYLRITGEGSPERGVSASGRDKFVVGAYLRDPALVHHHDAIGSRRRGEPVCDYQRRAARTPKSSVAWVTAASEARSSAAVASSSSSMSGSTS